MEDFTNTLLEPGLLVKSLLTLMNLPQHLKAKTAMSADRRQSPRKRVLRRGKVVFRNGYSVIDCVVLDLSDEGARLRLANVPGLPDIFELRIESGPAQRVTICYRGMDIAGVRFLPGTAA